MNANRLRKKNKVNGLDPTFRNKLNYLMWVNRFGNRDMKYCISVINYKPYLGIRSSHIERQNPELHYLE